MPYGTVWAVELELTDVMDKIVVDDWGQAGAGPLGALRAHVDSGRLNRDNLHAELGEIVCGARPAASPTTRRSCSGTAACRSPTWRSAEAMLDKARTRGLGTSCRTAELGAQTAVGCSSPAADSRRRHIVTA